MGMLMEIKAMEQAGLDSVQRMTTKANVNYFCRCIPALMSTLYVKLFYKKTCPKILPMKTPSPAHNINKKILYGF